jgi:hypothetical protein
MSVTVTAGSEKRYDLLKVVDEHLITEALTLTQQNFAAERYGPEDEEGDLKLDSALMPDLLKQSNVLPYMLDLGR